MGGWVEDFPAMELYIQVSFKIVKKRMCPVKGEGNIF